MRIILISLRTVAVIAAAGLAASSAACGSPASSGRDEQGRLRVVAAFYPLAEAARRVGGDRVVVEDLTPAGAEPHDLEVTTSQAVHIQDAGVTLVLGHGFQPSVEKAARGRSNTVAVLDRLPAPASDASDAADPHVWLDPVVMQDIVRVVADALVAADPAGQPEYEARRAAYVSELQALDGRYRSGLATCPRRLLVTAHQAFGRLAARYGLRQEGIAGIAPEAEPDPNRLAKLAALVRRDGVTTIFTEALVSPRVAATLAREAGVRTDVLDPLETLSRREQVAGAGYVSVMDANLAKIRSALGCA